MQMSGNVGRVRKRAKKDGNGVAGEEVEVEGKQ